MRFFQASFVEAFSIIIIKHSNSRRAFHGIPNTDPYPQTKLDSEEKFGLKNLPQVFTNMLTQSFENTRVFHSFIGTFYVWITTQNKDKMLVYATSVVWRSCRLLHFRVHTVHCKWMNCTNQMLFFSIFEVNWTVQKWKICNRNGNDSSVRMEMDDIWTSV